MYELKTEVLQKHIELLGERPYREVAPLMQAIAKEAQEQVQEKYGARPSHTRLSDNVALAVKDTVEHHLGFPIVFPDPLPTETESTDE